MSQIEPEMFKREKKMLDRLFVVRGEWVMVEQHLAELFQVDIKTLKQAVRRNRRRFANDFMFKMSDNEFVTWRNDPRLSASDRIFFRYSPFCFTEQGLMMLSCVLKNKTAIELSVRVVRIFVKMRRYALMHKEIRPKLAKLERKLAGDDEGIRDIFFALKELMRNPA